MNIKSFFLFVAFAATVFAADNAATQTPVNLATETVKSDNKLSDVSADFLRFALNKAEKYSGKVEDAIGKGVDLAIQEAPETARQWLTWKFYYHTMIATAGFTLLVISLCVVIFSFIRLNETSNEIWIFSSVFSCLATLVCLIALFLGSAGGKGKSGFEHAMCAIQIKVAPRVYMIEELTKLVK